MATVTYGPSGSSLNDLPPGGAENWVMWGFSWGDVVEITAHPLAWINGKDRRLAVSNVQSEAAPDGSRRIFFTVTNIGSSDLNYGVFTSWISA
jgi:hypothetical protein